jgi:hypothetical protein
MADYSAIRAHFQDQKLHYFTFHRKSEKTIKFVIRYLPIDTRAGDIFGGLVHLVFDIISVKQMTSRTSPEKVNKQANIPLFLITLNSKDKSKDIFKLRSLCYVAVSVEAYRAQSSLTQCYNCQKCGHMWANCRQSPLFVWCGGGHLHKKCPEKETKETSVPRCCNYSLKECERPHPSNYRGCSHAKEESL